MLLLFGEDTLLNLLYPKKSAAGISSFIDKENTMYIM